MEAATTAARGRIGRRSIATSLLRLRSDDQLVVLVEAGSDDAFDAIHDRYRERLATYARQMLGDDADVEDTVQDVFLHAYRVLRADAQPLALDTWLYGMVHSRCVARPERPLPASDDVLETSRLLAPDPFAHVERQEDADRALADLRFLTEHQRSALLMREIDGMSYSQLAVALGISETAVRSLLMRARLGLLEHVTARDASCEEIRQNLLDAHDSGGRLSRRARRHVRACSACADVRRRLFAVRRSLSALSPSAGIAKLLGFGAGGASAAGGGGGALLGGGASFGVGHIAAVICCVAGIGGTVVAIDGGGRPDRQGREVRAAQSSADRAASVTRVPHVRSQRRDTTPNRDKDIVVSPRGPGDVEGASPVPTSAQPDIDGTAPPSAGEHADTAASTTPPVRQISAAGAAPQAPQQSPATAADPGDTLQSGVAAVTTSPIVPAVVPQAVDTTGQTLQGVADIVTGVVTPVVNGTVSGLVPLRR